MTQSGALKSVAALAIVAMTAGFSNAAFQTKGTLTKTAKATLTTPGTITLNSLTVKKISDNSTVTDVAWTNPALGAWAIADDYLVLDATSTLAGSGVQIWTDNINGTAPDKSTLTAQQRVTITPAGLVDEANPQKSIPLAWAVKQNLSPAFTAVDPNAGTAFPDSFAWHYTPDKGSLDNPATATVNEAYADGADYQTIQNTSGIHFGQQATDYGAATNPKIVYLEGDFVSAASPDTYGTTTLTVEAFVQ